jgi:hypothetical protein
MLLRPFSKSATGAAEALPVPHILAALFPYRSHLGGHVAEQALPKNNLFKQNN